MEKEEGVMDAGKEKYKWFIARIAYRSEWKVKDLLDIAGINYYMPFHHTLRTWNGIQKEFQVPLLPSCVFIRIEESDFIMLHMMQEVSLILNMDGKPVCLAEDKMNQVLEKLDNSDDKGKIVLQLIDELAHS